MENYEIISRMIEFGVEPTIEFNTPIEDEGEVEVIDTTINDLPF
jgi:hypothetical protein